MLPAGLTRWDRPAARAGMLCAPVVGLTVGVLAAATGLVLLTLGAGPLLAAVASVAVPAALTRGCTWTDWPTPRTDWAAASPPRTRCGS